MLGAHSYKQRAKQASMHAASNCQTTKTTNQDRDRQRRFELPYHTWRQDHKKTPRTWVLPGSSPLAMLLGLAFLRMHLRDSNCSAIQHSVKVGIREGRQKASERPWCRFGREWHTKKQPHSSIKPIERKVGRRWILEKRTGSATREELCLRDKLMA
jgi:hypothetical protein